MNFPPIKRAQRSMGRLYRVVKNPQSGLWCCVTIPSNSIQFSSLSRKTALEWASLNEPDNGEQSKVMHV